MSFFSPVQSNNIPMIILGSERKISNSPEDEYPYMLSDCAGGAPYLVTANLSGVASPRYVALWLPVPVGSSPGRSVTVCWRYMYYSWTTNPASHIVPPAFQVMAYSCPSRPDGGTARFTSTNAQLESLSGLYGSKDLNGINHVPTLIASYLTRVSSVTGTDTAGVPADMQCFLSVRLPYVTAGSPPTIVWAIKGLAVDQW